MARLKSEKHHWWPRCVSRHWVGDDRMTGRMAPDGKVVRSNPQQFGVIRNAHHIKLGKAPEESSVWDSSFEGEFDKADGSFPMLLDWLMSVEHDRAGVFEPKEATDDQISTLVECATSLAVRGPRNRESCVALAERVRGPLQGRERNTIIGANMQRSQRLIADTIGVSGKFAVLLSRDREFIFGDGFFHNLLCVVNPPHNPKMLVPLTPTMAVVVTRPSAYRTSPDSSRI